MKYYFDKWGGEIIREFTKNKQTFFTVLISLHDLLIFDTLLEMSKSINLLYFLRLQN